jgi:hypothetical protein
MYENEKDEFQEILKEVKVKIQRKKDHLLIEQTVVKKVVSRALFSMPGLVQEENEVVEVQVMKLVEAIQGLQERIMELDIQAVPSTSQEVCEQREESAKSAVERIRTLTSECKQLSDRSAYTYECLTKDLKVRKLEVQLEEAQQ